VQGFVRRVRRCALIAALAAELVGGSAWSQESFASLLLEDSLSFTLPKGFSPVPVVSNGDVHYQYAMKAPAVKAEIRYAIFPSSPNEQFAASFLETICLNLSGGKTCDFRPFPRPAVKREFGADGGLTSITKLDSEFGKGYASCMVNLIHKNGVADVYILILFDDVNVLQSLVLQDPVFHALRFK
jgi:hypothetical protein